MRHSLLAILLGAVFAFSANAQTPVKLHLEDGSVIRASLVNASLPFETPYGTLTIPVADVVRIRLGHHPSPGEQTSLTNATRALGSAIHKERDAASKTLRQLGRLSIPAMRKAAQSGDAEVKKPK